MALSVPRLPGTNAVCSGLITELRKGLSLATMIFVTILYTVLHRLISLKLLRVSGPWILGISAIWVLFR